MKIIIISDGRIDNKNFHKKLLRDSDLIICADGGAENAISLKITPDYIIGDMDSIKKSTLKKLNKTHIITDKNQDKTDTQLAIELAQKFKPKEIIILGAIGTRIDHTLANIFRLNSKIKIIDNKNEIDLVEKQITLQGKKNDTVSIIALTDVKGLTYSGLKWKVKNKNVKAGWIGISNKIVKKKASITLKKGKILVIKAKD